MLLTPFTPDPLPGTYERIYSACRVCVAHRSEGLYENLTLEVERCVADVRRRLFAVDKKGVDWVQPFVEACAWFEKQVGLMESLFAYLDRVYIHTLPGSLSIRCVLSFNRKHAELIYL